MFACLFAFWSCGTPALPLDWPLTRAEKTSYAETSHYDDVIAFCTALQRETPDLSIQFNGQSAEGRPIPMIIASRPLVTTPAQAKATGKPIVYIQANIHAGEVEGKEAAQMILRDYLRAQSGNLDKLILIINPIYNADGNEKFAPQSRNRPGQNGPEMVGVRANGQGLDLNRDCIKAESPEMRSALENIYTKWDPDVVMDLHTTDGVRHGFDLTYSPTTNPNVDQAVLHYSRDVLLPAVRKTMREQHRWEFFDYIGDLNYQGKRAWCTFGSEARYVSNYGGFRNRIAILSEAVSYLPFKDRVETTYQFVDALLTKIAADAALVTKMTRDADKRTIEWANSGGEHRLGVRFELDSRGEEFVLLEKQPPAGTPRPAGRPTNIERVKMPIYDRFKASRYEKFPAAYLIPAEQTKTVDLLLLHGAAVMQAKEDGSVSGESFTISAFQQAQNPFQNHKLITLEGSYAPEKIAIKKGDYIVPCAQPIGGLIFYILEPESTDGAAAWGFLGETFAQGQIYPIRKMYVWPRVAAERVFSSRPKEASNETADLARGKAAH